MVQIRQTELYMLNIWKVLSNYSIGSFPTSLEIRYGNANVCFRRDVDQGAENGRGSGDRPRLVPRAALHHPALQHPAVQRLLLLRAEGNRANQVRLSLVLLPYT